VRSQWRVTKVRGTVIEGSVVIDEVPATWTEGSVLGWGGGVERVRLVKMV
jgi:hypothetical protein